jgi:hypothetical protein
VALGRRIAAEFGGVGATGLIPLTKDFESRSKGN